VVPELTASDGSQTEAALMEDVIDFINENEYCLRNSLWCRSPELIHAFVQGVRDSGLLKINDSHIGFVPYLATHGGRGLTGGPHGELHYGALRSSHMQGVVIAS
jgi:delta 1-pyrroline-5-carboxylate dehydrogenase